MENLNKQALANARKSIAARFSETSHLDDLESYRNLIQKQLVSADSKLNVAVQGKLDALKRAVDLMDESASKLNQFTKNMAWINDRINQTCTSISNYEHLRKVHHARENLNKVISQVDFFGRVPERIAVLRQLLDSEPYHIKDVFVEAISHDALRQALLKEIKAANVGRRKSSADDTVSTKRRASVGGSAENEANLVRIRQVVENHLSIVPQLLRDIRARLWDNLERIWSLCAESPADIVVTFEILEMYQEYITRRADQARQRAERLGSDPESAYKQAYEHITGEARDRLKRKFDEKVESTFVLMQNSAVEGGVTGGEQKDSQVTITLNAATQMLTLMSSFRHEIVPCVPESYAPMTLFLDALDNYLVPEILQLVDTSTSEGISSLDVGDVIQLIDWLEYYVGQMDIIDQSDRESVEKFTTIAEELLNEYLDRIKHQVMEWFTNIKNQTTEIVVNNDGTLFTAKPEDMFNVLHMQMAVATEKLPREHLKDVVNACLSVLRDVQRSSYDNITDNWKSMDPESVCAFINDSHRMMEKCNEFSEQILDMIPQTDHREMLSAMAEAVSKEYITLAHTGVTFLSRCILEDLEDAVFGCLFTVDWENDVDNHPLSSMVCATLNDYMSDIEQWLGGSYCERFIEDVLVQVVVAYIMSIRKQAHDTYQFKSEFVAARGMIVDSEQFKTFFHKLLSDREKTKAEMMEDSGQDEDGEYNDMGYESSSSYQANVVRIANLVKGSIEPITQLARVVSATHITGAEDDVKHLYGRYHGDGLKAVIAAIQCNPSMNTQEKRENMETAIKIFTTGGSGNRNGSGFSSVCSDAFKNIDAIPFDAATPITRISAVGAEDDNRRSTFTRAKSRMTWGRRKQNDA